MKMSQYFEHSQIDKKVLSFSLLFLRFVLENVNENDESTRGPPQPSYGRKKSQKVENNFWQYLNEYRTHTVFMHRIN